MAIKEIKEKMTKEELLAEEHICNGKCQDDITKNYVHCKTCTRLNDFLAGYKAGTEPREKRLQEKDKKITELEAQIEKMKSCENCKYKYIQDSCDLGEGTRTDPCLSCRSNNMWEFENE